MGFKDKPWHFVALTSLILVHYFALISYLTNRRPWLYWTTLLLPVGFLCVVKSYSVLAMLGVSYLTFRLCYLTAEAKLTKSFDLKPLAYLEFAFYLPIFTMGPILRFAEFHQSKTELTQQGVFDNLFRMLWGIFKFKVLSAMCLPMTFSLLFSDGYRHDITDFTIACFADFIYIYLNFSGFMDIVIATAALTGKRLPENFNHPFKSRNIQDFWNRWHITLLSFMRDMFFMPIVKVLTKRTGFASARIITVMLLVTFTLTGVWHGFGWNYLIYGLFHGTGLVAHNIYSRFLTTRLGAEGIKAYQLMAVPRVIGTLATLVFVAFSMFFFVNDMPTIQKIFKEVLIYSF